MKTDEITLAIQELIDYTYGKPGHFTWINGQAVMLMKMVENSKYMIFKEDEKVYLGICERILRELCVNTHNPNAKKTYFTFGG